MSERATCWSITINNPSEEELKPSLPAKWSMSGQLEKGEEEGTVHYQGMLKTPQVRFSAVKQVFPRAHIEVARNKQALEKYVHKEETRLSTVNDHSSNIPSLFDYQHTIARKWNRTDFAVYVERHDGKLSDDDIALQYVDDLVANDIRAGVCGVEYIAINPMWRSAWKKFWRAMIHREQVLISQENNISIPDIENALSSSSDPPSLNPSPSQPLPTAQTSLQTS